MLAKVRLFQLCLSIGRRMASTNCFARVGFIKADSPIGTWILMSLVEPFGVLLSIGASLLAEVARAFPRL